MSQLFSRYATPFITGLFLVSLISGIFLFFHVGNAAFHGMHEWLSMVLILPFVLHIWRNWRPFCNYFKRLPMAAALAVSIVAAVAFAWPSLTGTTTGGRGGNPAFAMAGIVTAATPAQLAPIIDKTEDEVITGLKAAGFTAAASDKKLAEIAADSGKPSNDLMSVIAGMGKTR
ncbi:DUF4405 domain-containing protein [Rhizobium halophytocola]|uniref:DUF4405 domain-containing protein n=1 Tax=Rhizobium halophytocola TaxID=735519 RepID=A0ABS4E6D6_9HYPH|nr:DUF4405 domain-containing protein [Rhizobium halophytocola]MBP1853483.1 hypothetical protein [Rhizobium halophytocola]